MVNRLVLSGKLIATALECFLFLTWTKTHWWIVSIFPRAFNISIRIFQFVRLLLSCWFFFWCYFKSIILFQISGTQPWRVSWHALCLQLFEKWLCKLLESLMCRSFQVGQEKFFVPWLFVINRKSSDVPMIEMQLVSPCFWRKCCLNIYNLEVPFIWLFHGTE